jgi:hypothetical protein
VENHASARTNGLQPGVSLFHSPLFLSIFSSFVILRKVSGSLLTLTMGLTQIGKHVTLPAAEIFRLPLAELLDLMRQATRFLFIGACQSVFDDPP